MIDKRVANENDISLQKADEFARNVYRVTKTFPKEEIFGLTSQLRRAALSIPLNIVEGFARISRQDHRRFLEISLGSVKEAKYLIYFSSEQKFISQEECDDLLKRGEELSKILWRKIETLRK